jgi:hypothetical protein
MVQRSSLVGFGAALCALVGVPVAHAATPDTWRAGPSMLVAREAPAVAKLADGRVLFVGSAFDVPTARTAEIYSPATNSFTSAGSLNVSRFFPLAATLSDGRVLVVGGDTGNERTAEVYAPATDSWTATANDMRDARATALITSTGGTVTALPGGEALAAGGTTTVNGTPTAHADRYMPSDNMFHNAADMHVARNVAAAAPLPGGKVLVVGGSDGTHALDSGEVYDPASDSWTPVENSLATPHVTPTAVPLPGGRVLVFGGTTTPNPFLGANNDTTGSEIYDPATNRFTPTGALVRSVVGASSAALSDGRVVAAGGATLIALGGAVLGSAQVYEPSVNGWVPAADPIGLTLVAGVALPGDEVLTTDVRAFFAPGSSAGRTQIYTPATPPAAPTGADALGGNSIAEVTWSPAADNGRPITRYTVRASNGATVSTPDGRTHARIAVPNGTPVTFAVTATNDLGTSAPSAPSAAVTPGASTTADTAAPTVKITGLRRKLKLKSFLKGVTATLTPSEPASLTVDLLAATRKAKIAKSFNLTVATKTFGRGGRRKLRLKPNRKLVGTAKRFSVRLRVIATDAAGNRTRTSKTIRVSG